MYTIISTIEEAIHSKKQQIRYQAEERNRIENEMDRNRKDVASLEQELNTLRQNIGQLNGMKTPPPPDCCVGLASNSDPIAMRKY